MKTLAGVLSRCSKKLPVIPCALQRETLRRRHGIFNGWKRAAARCTRSRIGNATLCAALRPG